MTPLTTHILYYLIINLSSYNKTVIKHCKWEIKLDITLNSADYGEIRLDTSPYIMLSSS